MKPAILPAPPTSSDYSLPNDGSAHGLGPWLAYASTISGGVVTDTPYLRSDVKPCTMLGPFSKSANVSPSAYYSGNLVDYVFDLGLILSSAVVPGDYSISCVLNGDINHPVVADQQITVYDATPAIDLVFQNEPDIQGQPFYVDVYGRSFGSLPGALTVCSSDPNHPTLPCSQAQEISVCLPLSNGNQNPLCPEAIWEFLAGSNSTQYHIKALITPDDPSHVASYDVAVTSKGANGQTFKPGQRSGDASATSPLSKRHGTLGTGVQPVMIFVIHGLGDTWTSMQPLADAIKLGLTKGQIVDYTFNYQVSNLGACKPIGGLFGVAADLAAFVTNKTLQFPRRRVAFVTHSLGGIIVRDMLAENMLTITAGVQAPKVVGLATLGTPHLGYPYLQDDGFAFNLARTFGVSQNMCSNQMQAVGSNISDGSYPITTAFLSTLESKFDIRAYNSQWFAAAGRACTNPTRTSLVSFPAVTNGCRVDGAGNANNDGLVCDDSARLSYPSTSLTPSITWYDSIPAYQHYPDMGSHILNVLCPTIPFALSIHSPLVGSPLYNALTEFLDAL